MHALFRTVGLALCACASLATTAAMAQDIRSERVAFAPGSSSTVITGTIVGDEIVDYLMTARGGQRAVIEMTSDNASANFNLQPSGSPEAIHNGSIYGNRFDGVLPTSGDWTLRVYLMRNAARRGETATFEISAAITDAAPAGGFADSDAGGPDWWAVTGIGTESQLNIRSGPSTENGIVARSFYGQRLRNLGCRTEGAERWCQVETASGDAQGWVAGRYLREGAPPQASGTTVTLPGTGSAAPDLNIRSTGEIEAAFSGGCTVLYNSSGRRLQAGASCSATQLDLADRTVAAHTN